MTARRITWFAPDRPVEGTVYVRPQATDEPESGSETAEPAHGSLEPNQSPTKRVFRR